MTRHPVEVDERTVAVENASYRWGYQFVSLGVLLSVAYRAFVLGQSSWDLLAIVVLGGLVTAVYQQRKGTLGRRWVRLGVLAVALALAVAAVVALAV